MQVTGRVQYIAGGSPYCFPSLPVCVYKSSSHYFNNVIFVDNSLGPLATESPCIIWNLLPYCLLLNTIIYLINEITILPDGRKTVVYDTAKEDFYRQGMWHA